jgi:hypothetical protein
MFRRLPLFVGLAAVVTGCAGLSADASGEDVGGNLGSLFVWAAGEPTATIGAIDPDTARELVDRAAAVIEPDRDDRFEITIVATFDTAEQAAARADGVRDILEDAASWYADPGNAAARSALGDPEQSAPLTPPEEAAMKANLLAPGTRGIGWGGDPGAADDAVYTLGPILVVTGLKSESRGDSDETQLHPLARLLAAVGGEVLLEGDRYGEGSIVADASCRLEPSASPDALRDELGEVIETSGQFSARPPWIGPPITAEERLARATYRRWTEGMAAAFNDQDLRELAQRMATTTDPSERQAAMAEFQREIVDRGLSKIEGELDLETLVLLLDPPAIDMSTFDASAYEAWQRTIGERMGQLPMRETEYGAAPFPDDYARLATTGSVTLNGDRLELGWTMFGRFAAGMPYLAAYLAEQGCVDMKLGTVDFDTVRGD